LLPKSLPKPSLGVAFLLGVDGQLTANSSLQ